MEITGSFFPELNLLYLLLYELLSQVDQSFFIKLAITTGLEGSEIETGHRSLSALVLKSDPCVTLSFLGHRVPVALVIPFRALDVKVFQLLSNFLPGPCADRLECARRVHTTPTLRTDLPTVLQEEESVRHSGPSHLRVLL